MPGRGHLWPADTEKSDGAPPTLIARPSREAGFSVTRMTNEAQAPGTLVTSPRVDSFGLTVFLADYPAFDLSVDGKAIRAAPARVGEFHLHDLNAGIFADLHQPLDVLFFHIPRQVLNTVSEECSLPRLDGSPMIPGLGVPDAVVQDLGASLLPSLRRMHGAHRLFMDHIGTALLVHLARTYGNARTRPRESESELAPSQLRRADEMMVARLDGDITLEELASQCTCRGGTSRARSKRSRVGRRIDGCSSAVSSGPATCFSTPTWGSPKSPSRRGLPIVDTSSAFSRGQQAPHRPIGGIIVDRRERTIRGRACELRKTRHPGPSCARTPPAPVAA